MKGKKIKLATGQTVGVVVGDTFKRHCKGSRHFLKYPERAISFLEKHLYQALRFGAVQVEITDDETNTRYVAPIAKIIEHGFVVDRGFGRQKALPLDEFERLPVVN